MKRFVLGTSGHVDHGKTSLVEALTGVNTDRLPEEKQRGISIELGYAPLRPAENIEICVVDVPGHERFVQTMVNGAAGVNAFLLVVACDEGIRPQTEEHLSILKLLGLTAGVCALTKSDLVDRETIETRIREVSALFPADASPTIVPISVKNGSGLSELKATLSNLSLKIAFPDPTSSPFLPIDRIFSLPGAGTIVTGTLRAGTLRVSDTIELYPSGQRANIRSLHIFNRSESVADAPTRLAVNLSGIHREKLKRGEVIGLPGALHPTRKLHASFQWSGEIPKNLLGNLRALNGTNETPARVILSKDFPNVGEIRFPSPFVVRCDDRLILRTASPARTIGGAEVIDLHPDVSIQKADLKSLPPLERARDWITRSARVSSTESMSRRLSMSSRELGAMLDSSKFPDLKNLDGEHWVGTMRLNQVEDKVLAHVSSNPGISTGDLLVDADRDSILLKGAVEELVRSETVTRRNDRFYSNSGDPKPNDPCRDLIRQGGLMPPNVEDIQMLLSLKKDVVRARLAEGERDGTLIRGTDDIFYAKEVISPLLEKIVRHFSAASVLTFADWKAAVGVSRKYALPLLEYFDREKVTLCRTDRNRIAGPKLYR